MKTIVIVAAFLLTAAPAVAESVTSCDSFIDPVESLSQETNTVLYIPDDWVTRTAARIESKTGEVYGHVDAITVVETSEHDIAVVFDEGGCNTQVELPRDFF